MQYINISGKETGKSLCEICKANGINIRAKQAKSKYIAAIETHNAAVDAECEAFTESFFTDETDNETGKETITTEETTMTQFIAKKIFQTVLLFINAAIYSFLLGQTCREYYETIVRDDYPFLALVTDVVTAIERIGSVELNLGEPLEAIVKAGFNTALTAIKRVDWLDLLVTIIARVILFKRRFYSNGEVWAVSQGAA